MAAHVQQPAPEFKAQGVVGGEFKEVKLSDFKGQYVYLFFWPLDFTFVCPTEIIAFSDRIEEFKKRGVQVIGVSVDSHFTHLAWKNTPRTQGGLGDIHYPMVADLNKQIARDYGVLLEGAGIALRGSFLIDKNGIVQQITINNLPLGRSVDEAIRLVDALQHFEKNGEVCPADWKPGSASIKPNVKDSKEYFSKANK
ncbi:MAG: peroxiredoxin [Gemmataceae bacterium]|nr:peroxiredoxin [Gemmataceae bacterium]